MLADIRELAFEAGNMGRPSSLVPGPREKQFKSLAVGKRTAISPRAPNRRNEFFTLLGIRVPLRVGCPFACNPYSDNEAHPLHPGQLDWNFGNSRIDVTYLRGRHEDNVSRRSSAGAGGCWPRLHRPATPGRSAIHRHPATQAGCELFLSTKPGELQ